MLGPSFEGHVGGGHETLVSPYSNHEQRILQVLALAFSLGSMFSVIVSFYCFLTMRRSFRHDLIMVLIHSDMFKALWFMVYSIGALMPETVVSSSKFCQVCGYFTAVGIEASDFAVLIIAIHSGLYIFRPPTSMGEGGLYRYRHIALGFWICLPGLMASLAFTNDRGAFISDTTSCYFPPRPLWYRLALSWIPRYFIVVTILGIDLSVYLYIHYKFGDFKSRNGSSGRRGTSTYQSSADRRRSDRRGRYGIPSMPQLVYNGLLPETRQASIVSLKTPIHSVASLPQVGRSKTFGESSIVNWRKTSSISAVQKAVSCPAISQYAILRDGNSLSQTVEGGASTSNPRTPLPIVTVSRESSWTTFASRLSSHSLSRISFISILRQRPRNNSISSNASGSLSELQLIDSEGQSLMNMSIVRTRKQIRQQLHFLFIYSLAYLGMWILPFITQVLQCSGNYVTHPPFALNVCVTIVITSQCAINSWIYILREKPWKHRAKNKKVFVQIPAFLRDLIVGRRRSVQTTTRVGKSRAAMAAEARVAYRRRDDEMAARASEIGSAQRRERGPKSWWDEPEDDDGDGLMSFLA